MEVQLVNMSTGLPMRIWFNVNPDPSTLLQIILAGVTAKKSFQGESPKYLSAKHVDRFYCENVRARDPSCFDFSLYAEKNADLKVFGDNKEVLFEHFVKRGQFEGRPFK